MIQNLKNDFKSLEEEIFYLSDKYDEIQKIRKKAGLSLAIYKCNDEFAKILIDIDKKINKKELQLKIIESKIRQLELENLKKTCKKEHAKIGDNKFMIRIPGLDDIYLKNETQVEEFVSKCKETQTNISVSEYIDCNNSRNKEVNRPIFIEILNLDFLKDTQQIIVPHQKNYTPYLQEVRRISDNAIISLREYGYNNSNEEIYCRYQTNNSNFILFHNPFSAKDYSFIQKFDNGDFFVRNGVFTNFETIRMKTLKSKYKLLLDKTIAYLEKCKNHNYDIESIKKILE